MKIEWPTAIVFVAALAGLVLGLKFHLDPQYLAPLGGLVLAIVSHMKPLFSMKESP